MFAAPQIGFSKLLQVPSNERYGVLTHRCGGAAHVIGFDACLANDGPGKKLLIENKNTHKTLINY